MPGVDTDGYPDETSGWGDEGGSGAYATGGVPHIQCPLYPPVDP